MEIFFLLLSRIFVFSFLALHLWCFFVWNSLLFAEFFIPEESLCLLLNWEVLNHSLNIFSVAPSFSSPLCFIKMLAFFLVLSHRPEALLLPFYVIFFLLFCSYIFQLTDSFLSPLHSAVELVHFSMLTFPPFKFLIFHICVLRLSIAVVSSVFIISHWSMLMMAVLDVR